VSDLPPLLAPSPFANAPLGVVFAIVDVLTKGGGARPARLLHRLVQVDLGPREKVWRNPSGYRRSVCVCVWVWVCVCVYVCVRMYVYVCVCMCV
jgi:hypothetical protein